MLKIKKSTYYTKAKKIENGINRKESWISRTLAKFKLLIVNLEAIFLARERLAASYLSIK
ncbi:hypothetical protein HYE02_02795 [Mycoplasmopsis bovis]|nr:hypothetical protein [Mycoplasmopsis bovis]QQH28322.1 hypothetical protein HYE02_02795 [Mycoplasmopsis bovis]